MSIIFSSGALSLKVIVISTCVLSVGVMLKHYSVLPLVSDFVSSYVPLQWLKPPYLYLVINGIIISIVASSKLQQKDNDDQISVPPPEEKVIIPSEASVLDYHHVHDLSDNMKVVGDLMMDGDDGVAEVEKPVTPPQRSDSMELSDSYEKKNKHKPPVSARFGHRKAVKASPEGTSLSPEGEKALRVSKSKRNDTLESTWKTITEGRAMPLTRHRKKSDTWESHVRQNTPPLAPKLKKTEIFNERSSSDNANAGRLKREPSPSQDELNRRVEAFIKKFNEDMRLQRQRSLEQYNQMINQGAN